MTTIQLRKALSQTGCTLPVFIDHAYQYAERKLKMKVAQNTVYEFEYGHDITDEIINDYILDVLARRAKPLTNQPRKRYEIQLRRG